MKKISFLSKLAKEGKLEIVEPSEEVCQAYLERAKESLSSAKALIQIGNLKDATAMSYYAMYHSLLALFFRVGIKCENHAASIFLLKEIFDIDNSNILAAKEERIDKQYYVDFETTKEEVSESIAIAEEFNTSMVHTIETLTNKKIQDLRETAQKHIL